MAPLALRDREAGTVTLTTSQAMWKKLARIRHNSGVAIAYHAREHGLTGRSGFVLVQGPSSFPITPDRDWLESITPEWERFLGPRMDGLPGRVLEVYYWHRVPITIQVERIVAYPDGAAASKPQVFGTPQAEPALAQKPPRGGTAPRVDATKVAAHAERLPHTLLGWCGSDDMPEVVPVAAVEGRDSGVELSVPAGSVPPGGRRAGLTLAPIPAAHDRPGAACSYRLAGERRLGPGDIHTAHQGRLPTSALKARFHPGEREHRLSDEESPRGRRRASALKRRRAPAALHYFARRRVHAGDSSHDRRASGCQASQHRELDGPRRRDHALARVALLRHQGSPRGTRLDRRACPRRSARRARRACAASRGRARRLVGRPPR